MTAAEVRVLPVPVAIRENNKAAVLGAGVFASLFFSNQRALVLGFGFKNDEGKTF
jgi:hypothetical protein